MLKQSEQGVSMTDLRKAAEMALEALEWNYGTDLENIENCMAWLEKMNATIPALRQALAQPVDAVNTSQERVDETAKRDHEPLVWMNKHGHVASFQNEEYKDPLYTAPQKREWVGLDGEIPGLGLVTEEFYNGMLFAEDVLRERNGG